MFKLIIGASLLSAAMPTSAEPLHLKCVGSGSGHRIDAATATSTNADGQRTTSTIYGSRTTGFQDEIDVDIDGVGGRIRVPTEMLPPIHGGLGDGWYELRKVVMTDSEITASAAVNGLNHPKVRLDRISGRLTVSGTAGSFSGECQPYDPATAARRF